MIVPKVRLSERKHLPVFYLLPNSRLSFLPQDALRLFIHSRGLSLRDEGDWCLVTHRKTTLALTPEKAATFIYEMRKWERGYLPPFELEGKTVLDVGAGCGETAYFYFKHGAKKVICVEPSEREMNLLRENARSLNWNVVTHCEPFNLRHLTSHSFDLMKIDCEGCEAKLLNLSKLDFPLVVEAHSVALMEQFQANGLRVISKLRKGDIFVLNNFHDEIMKVVVSIPMLQKHGH